MNKIITCTLCLLLLLLAACGASQPSETDPVESPPEPATAPAGQAQFYRFSGFVGGNSLYPLAGNEYGAYLSAIRADSVDDQGNPVSDASGPVREMLYIDYAKGEIAPLEGQEFKADDLFSYFLCIGDYLYGFYCGGPREEVPCYVFRTALDGSNRIQYDLPQGWCIRAPGGAVYVDGSFSLLLYSDSAESAGELRNCLLKLDPETGECSTQELSVTGYWSFQGYLEDSYLLTSFDPEDPNSDQIGRVAYLYRPSDQSLTAYSWEASAGASGDFAVNDLFAGNAISPREPGDIVAETDLDYLVFLGHEGPGEKYFGLDKNTFPAFGLISKTDYVAGLETYRVLERNF